VDAAWVLVVDAEVVVDIADHRGIADFP